MGSSVEKSVKRAVIPIKDKKVRQAVEAPFRTGASGQQRQATKLSLLQSQREKARLAEAEDEVSRRRGLASSKTAGRQSLIRSTGGGLTKTLGG